MFQRFRLAKSNESAIAIDTFNKYVNTRRFLFVVYLPILILRWVGLNLLELLWSTEWNLEGSSGFILTHL